MDELEFYDAHCYVGRYRTFRAGSFYSPEDLISYMDYFGISEALVTHTMSREYHPVDGNAAVLSVARDRERLHSCWALIPTATKELPDPATLIREMTSNGTRCARLFYGSHSFSLSDWCIGDLLDQLEAHRIPVFVDPDIELDAVEPSSFDWNGIDSLCRSHPNLPVILSAAHFGTSRRQLYQLLSSHPMLHVETSGLWFEGAIQFVSSEFGASRLIFGTRLPIRQAGCSISQITYADISDADKRLVAGDNLRQLIGGVVE